MSNGEAREMGGGGRHAELADVRWGGAWWVGGWQDNKYER